MKIPNIKKLEIDITHACSLACLNCDRGLSLMPGNKDTHMDVEQIRKLVSQSVALNHPWEQIRIMGGEATIHPDFEEIVRILFAYKEEHNPSLRLIVSSNGYTPVTKKKLMWLEENYPTIMIENTNKVDNYQKGFNIVHQAPCDLPKNKEHEYTGCWTTEACGLGLNRAGFYCCAVGGAIDKFFKYNIGIKDLADATVENMSKMFNPLCSKCGRYEHLNVDDNNIQLVVSETWEECMDNFDEKVLLDRY
ncbi:radical SAM protein [Paenibacillus sp. M1]|uniref:Radical SAM protein n=1 Tax=Paenibacillus haidiansis TaxID=1574488 RepID=A0ABU7VNK0_9BACL